MPDHAKKLGELAAWLREAAEDLGTEIHGYEDEAERIELIAYVLDALGPVVGRLSNMQEGDEYAIVYESDARAFLAAVENLK